MALLSHWEACRRWSRQDIRGIVYVFEASGLATVLKRKEVALKVRMYLDVLAALSSFGFVAAITFGMI
jgi:hypothetical protein